MKIAIIGLDTSHTIEFTKLIQAPETPDNLKIKELQITKCMRFPSPFQAEDKQDERQAQLEKWGVKVTRSFEEAVDGAEGVMIEINDPAMHLEHFKKAAALGKAIYLDKPLAGNIKDGKEILKITKKQNLKVWSASSLRFTSEIENAAKEISEPVMAHAYGPLGIAPAGSSLVWYGVHTFEMINKLMGAGAESVFAREDKNGIVTTVKYGGDRRGLAECNTNAWFYGGRAQSKDKVSAFSVNTGIPGGLYHKLILHIKDFFTKGVIPVSLDNAYEILAIMEAAEKSIASGKEEKVC